MHGGFLNRFYKFRFSTWYLVFFLNNGIDNFIAFLLCGVIPWIWFERSVLNASNSIIDGRHLVSQISIAKAFFPMVVILQDSVKQSLAFTMLFSMVLLSGVTFGYAWVALVPLIFVQFSLIAFVAHLVAALVPFIPDLRFVIVTLMQLLFFGSGIFYHHDVILPEHRQIFFLNPLALLIRSYREVILENTFPNFISLAMIFLFSILGLLCALYILRKYSRAYPRLVVK